MSGYRSRGGYPQSEPRSYQGRPRDDFYDDRRSRSRSPDRRYNSPPRRRTPPHDISRPPRGPGQYQFSGKSPPYHNNRDREHGYSTRRSPSPRRGRSYHDRDRPLDNDYERRRGGSRTPERSSSRGYPSKQILMDGLAPHLSENDISTELKQNYRVGRLDDVRIVRDRQTKQSRQFGFLRFSTLEDAEDFMSRNYPTIYLYGDSSKGSGTADDSKVRLSYGKDRSESDWICSNCNINNYSTRSKCFKCQTPKSAPKVPNSGDNDASPDNIPSQFVLFRGLESSVTEELFARGVGKLNRPGGTAAQPTLTGGKKSAKVASTTGDSNLGARDGTLRRVLLIRDRRSNESWRYGFAEYASIEDAQAALTRYNSFDRFTIASKHVLASYIHAGVFVPVLDPNPSIERFLFSPLNNPSLKLAYWDEDAYVTELVVSASEPADANDNAEHPAKLAQSEGLKSTADKIKKRKAVADANPTTKKPASHLQFWSNRHAELHGITPGSNRSTSAPSSENGDSASSPAVAPTQSFIDPERHCCYLCMRQLGSTAEANTHERVSDLHRANLRNKPKIAKALGKLTKHGIEILPTDTPDGAASEYRDRAKERRRVHGVVNKKGEVVGGKKGPGADGPSHQDTSAEPAKPSKGAALLSKMGYTAGAGLGAQGEGMTAPISQNVYAAGVGLGMQGGNMGDAVAEAERNTKGNGFGDWVAQGKERARERYERMG